MREREGEREHESVKGKHIEEVRFEKYEEIEKSRKKKMRVQRAGERLGSERSEFYNRLASFRKLFQFSLYTSSSA